MSPSLMSVITKVEPLFVTSYRTLTSIYPFVFIDSQDYQYHSSLEFLINDRNLKTTNHASVYRQGVLNGEALRELYGKTKILLILSLVDETFCRVAYEGMMNELPILSTNYGNLKYLMSGYADFLDEDPKLWAEKINQIYFDKSYLEQMRQRPKTINPLLDKQLFISAVKSTVVPANYLLDQNIGIFCPWADQGLGIQSREYYNVLTKLGYTVSVLSFRPFITQNPKILTCKRIQLSLIILIFTIVEI